MLNGDVDHALAELVWDVSRRDEGTISVTGAQHVARAVTAAGWRRDAAARAEVAALRGVVEAVQALADEWERRAGDRAARPKSRIDIHEAVDSIRAVLAPVSSSGEAESGGGRGDCTICGLDDRTCTTRYADGADPCCEACRYGDTHERTPAPVSSGGQADGEGEGWPGRDPLFKAVIDVCWKATQYGTTEDGDTLAYILPKGAIHRLVGAAQSAGIPAALRASGVPAPEDEPTAARPVLSREAIERVLRPHGVYGFTGDQIACVCDHKVWRDRQQHGLHLADVLTAGGEQR